MPINSIDEVVQAQKQGVPLGITSVCSANPHVLRAAFQMAARSGTPALVEATCNQVNQFGGYTGMNPAAFVRFIRRIAVEAGLSVENIILGGDHLGPSPWQNGPVERCMTNASNLVLEYARAGFTKLHLDASMHLSSDDKSRPLDMELVARRTAWLAQAAESAASQENLPRYVIGSEVPVPGGASAYQARVHVTDVTHARHTLEAARTAFQEAGLDSAWERVIALVVQPGVEFGDDFVWDYDPAKARDLSQFSEGTPFVYEAHSTDYQSRDKLREMVSDHFAILKVGPALTSAFREAVFALASMEDQLLPAGMRSNIVQVVDDAMLTNPGYWVKYYRGTPAEQAYKRKYSLSDRIRYYWSIPQVDTALKQLLRNLETAALPESLIGWFSPLLLEEIHDRQLPATPQAIIQRHIQLVLEDYQFACT